ncbi:MAG: bifunctional phosphopantothenoylcysteine decarboxylase/phosphopantothenate--cysteine ligase CoaBC, partial [Firmicutes bacterium]|nr:bifunctional phosphopantothenoylcysteine decarboxylase/phosphopantothenate--cysteine ligase CoaBC [Bacillota bacterium]
MLKNKIILLGLTGGIAAYKGAELARLLIKEGAAVQAVMTDNAKAFLAPLTLRSLTGRPVYSALFEPSYGSATIHIDLAREPQAFVVAPATANFLGKLAAGLADDLLTTLFLAVDPLKRPVILAPAMNTAMFHNPVVQENIERLRRRGFVIADPSSGVLACGDVGKGRMVEPAGLLKLIRDKLLAPVIVPDYRGQTILITAGPTREPLDPVRFISNYSSGRMGYALARAAKERGAQVILVTGPTSLEPPPGVELCPIESAREMHRVVMEKLPIAQIVIKTAAVADYRPAESQPQKVKKGGDLVLRLVRNP